MMKTPTSISIEQMVKTLTSLSLRFKHVWWGDAEDVDGICDSICDSICDRICDSICDSNFVSD